MKRIFFTCLLGVLCSYPLTCVAANFDGSKAMICATIEANECTKSGGCNEVDLDIIGLPRFVVIDLPNNVIHPTKDSGIERKSPIKEMQEVDGKLILQGAGPGQDGIRDGVGWTIAISKVSGDLILTASGEGVAFVVYGACTIHQ